MMSLSSEVLDVLSGKTLATAESCTGGGIGAALTDVPGASAVYLGGIISYTNQVKREVLGVPEETLSVYGAVSSETAVEMAIGVRRLLHSDVGVSVTGLAGPDGDSFNNPVGTVFVGYSDTEKTIFRQYFFRGSRSVIRDQATHAALELILENIKDRKAQ